MVNGANGKTYQSHIAYSETGNPLTKYVNLCQSAEERRDKYAFCRFFGMSVMISMRLRDWHWTKINMFIEAYKAALIENNLSLAVNGPADRIKGDFNN